MKKVNVALLTIFLFFSFSSCVKIFKDKIEGKVIEQKSGLPISGVTVTLYEHHCEDCLNEMVGAVTNEKGNFKLSDHLTRNENYQLRVYLADYYMGMYQFNESDKDFTNIEIQMQKK